MTRSLGDSLPDPSRFEAAVEAILGDQAREDQEPGTSLTGGITFRTGRPGRELLRDWHDLLDGRRREAWA